MDLMRLKRIEQPINYRCGTYNPTKGPTYSRIYKPTLGPEPIKTGCAIVPKEDEECKCQMCGDRGIRTIRTNR